MTSIRLPFGGVPLKRDPHTARLEEWLRVRELAMPLNAKVLGCRADGSNDDTSRLIRACRLALEKKSALYLPTGIYRYSALPFDITDRLTIFGDGPRRTILKPFSSYTGFAIRIDDCWRNNAEDANGLTTVDLDESRAGVVLRGFSVIGDRGTEANGLQTNDRLDHLHMEQVEFQYLKGTALQLGVEGDTNALVRECGFLDVVVANCGNGASVPAAHITNGDSGGDGTNQLWFTQSKFLYNFGPVLIESNPDDTNKTVRRINFTSLMMHGRNDLADAPASDVMQIKGDVQAVVFEGLRTNGSPDVAGTKYACIRLMEDDNGNAPTFVQINGYDLRACQGHGIVVEKVTRLRVHGTAQPTAVDGNEVRFESSSVVGGAIYDVEATGTRSIHIDSTVAGVVRQNGEIDHLRSAGAEAGGFDTNGDVIAEGGFLTAVDGWYQNNAAASQTDVALTRLSGPGHAANAWIAPVGGSILRVWVSSNEARTAGTLEVEVYKNGSLFADATPTAVQINASNTTGRSLPVDKDEATFAFGDQLEIRVTTSATWAPVTADIRAGIVVETSL